MFTELMPLIQRRPITITVVPDGPTQLRVNVIPQKLDKDAEANSKMTHVHRKELNELPKEALAALTTPLSITGTPAELDADFPKTLTSFVSQHQTLQQSVDTATQQISDAIKAIDEREKTKKAQDKKDSKDNKSAKNDEKKASSGNKEKPAEESGLPSLFMAAPTAVTAQGTSAGNPSDSGAKGGE